MTTTSVALPATLRPSRVKLVVLFLTCLMFVLGGVWMVLEGEPLGYLCGGSFAIGLLVFALQFHPNASYLRLTEEGFTFCGLFRAHTVPWSHVREFGVTLGRQRMVAWNYTTEHSPAGRVIAFNRALTNYEAALPDTYGMSGTELAELLENLRQRYSSRVGTSPGVLP